MFLVSLYHGAIGVHDYFMILSKYLGRSTFTSINTGPLYFIQSFGNFEVIFWCQFHCDRFLTKLLVFPSESLVKSSYFCTKALLTNPFNAKAAFIWEQTREKKHGWLCTLSRRHEITFAVALCNNVNQS